MSKKWKDTEINYLKRFAASKRLDELAQRFDREPAEVRSKLAELGLASKDGPAAAGTATDPLVENFEKGLEALHKGDWATAEKQFGRVVEESDLLELTGRARQYQAICLARLGEGKGGEEEDPFVRAVYHKNRGEYEAALKLCDGSPEEGDERFLYLAASIHALQGREEEAAEALERAVELNPKNRVHAYHDPDFAELRQDPERAALFGLA